MGALDQDGWWGGGWTLLPSSLASVCGEHLVQRCCQILAFDPATGYSGLLANKHAAVIYTGAVYGPDRGQSFGSFQQPPLGRREAVAVGGGVELDVKTISVPVPR